jgi:predicted N-acetyltransferase YhbS
VEIDEIRSPEHLAQLSALLDQAFGVPPGQRYFDDFPVWERTASAGAGPLLRLGAFDQNQLVSSACVRIAQLKTPGPDLPIALIGAVATGEQWRGKGLASQLVELACAWACEHGAAFVMLWGSEHELYRKLGFELSGQQLRVPIGDLQLAKSSKCTVQQGWAPGIFASLRERDGGLRLGDDDRSWMERHRNVRWYWTGPRDAPTAYAGFGRGIDLQNIVHEWGGESGELSAILSRIHAEFPEATLLASPTQMKERFSVEPGAGTGETEFLALVRKLDPGLSFEFWQNFWIWGLDAA